MHNGLVPRYGTAIAVALAASACNGGTDTNQVRASGYVEATEVRIAPEVGGRILELDVKEGDRVGAGHIVGRLDATEIELALRRARAEHDQVAALLRLLQAGSRVEDIRQAQAQVEAAQAEQGAAKAEVDWAEADLQRFELLLEANAGSRKQRDDAAARRDMARERLRATDERVRAARAALARLRAGPRAQEIAAARARVAAVDAQIASIQKSLDDATVRSPVAGIVSEKLANAGEIVAPRTPIIVVTDLDNAWINVFIDEPFVPRLQLGQSGTVTTDAGSRVTGTVTFISQRAEFTPRNVQTAEERSKLVYRIKVSVDNRRGVLKQGMPVEVELPLGSDEWSKGE
ncbi:MAG: efflux RND transporter periplasmic adaptor subunit [Acidobacteria bacterium]|nr:efflux RND transporter periplasmic adaptor subunit [Acidobacteriota bacterium]